MVVGLLWLAAGFRLRALQRSATFINGSFAVSTAAIAAACTWKVTSSSATIGPSARGDLPEHLLLVVAAVAAQLLLLSLRSGRPNSLAIASRLAVAGAVAVAMATTYARLPDTAADVIYRLVFHGYLSFALIESLRLCLRYSRSFTDVGRRANLTLIGWGSAVGLVYSLSRLLYVLVDLVVDPAPTVIHTAGTGAALLGASGIALGVIAPRTVRVSHRWYRAIRQTRRLDPLWRDLATAYPEITLPTDRPSTMHRAELRLHRRVLEVAEGLARARVPAAGVWPVASIEGQARVLHDNRPSWTANVGPSVAQLLPPAPSAEDERRQLTALADSYRTLRHRSRVPSPGVPA